eukprot:1210609-Prymnesium_polylepis.1
MRISVSPRDRGRRRRCGDADGSDAAGPAGAGADGRAGTQQQQGDCQAARRACAGTGGPDECPCTRAAPALSCDPRRARHAEQQPTRHGRRRRAGLQ